MLDFFAFACTFLLRFFFTSHFFFCLFQGEEAVFVAFLLPPPEPAFFCYLPKTYSLPAQVHLIFFFPPTTVEVGGVLPGCFGKVANGSNRASDELTQRSWNDTLILYFELLFKYFISFLTFFSQFLNTIFWVCYHCSIAILLVHIFICANLWKSIPVKTINFSI